MIKENAVKTIKINEMKNKENLIDIREVKEGVLRVLKIFQ